MNRKLSVVDELTCRFYKVGGQLPMHQAAAPR
jgi:hypothetical protein